MVIEDLLRDFRAEGPAESAILSKLQLFLAQHSQAALGSDVAGEIGHITASAWIVDSQTSNVLLVWGRKEAAWKLPGAHCDSNPLETAKNEAARALGNDCLTKEPQLWSLAERNIPAYWNTPAHQHFELVFRFVELIKNELPRGARWFPRVQAGMLNDPTLARLIAKS